MKLKLEIDLESDYLESEILDIMKHLGEHLDRNGLQSKIIMDSNGNTVGCLTVRL